MKKLFSGLALLGFSFAAHAQAILLANDYNFWNAPIGTEHYCVARGIGRPGPGSLYECKDVEIHLEYYNIAPKGWAVVRTEEVQYFNGVGYNIQIKKIR